MRQKLSYGYCYHERLFVNIFKCYKKEKLHNLKVCLDIYTHMDGKCCLGNMYVIS